MLKSPFKFLDSYTEEDRDIFFGRDKEIEELYLRVFENKILVVYGTSGTGKSSLINCGLANKFNDSDWLPVNVRRGGNINQSLFDSLLKNAVSRSPFEKIARENLTRYDLERLIKSLYLDHFRPVYLIFDQFEELFIFGSREEKDELVRNIKRVLDSDIQCRFIFIIREEYLAGITEFEHHIPTFLSNRIRIEKMTRLNAVQTIEGPCGVNNIAVEPGFADALLEKLNPDSPEVELTWLQVFLDKVMKLAEEQDHVVRSIRKDIIENLGDVKDLLGSFLEEQISQLTDPEAGLVILKSFVSVKGTKQQETEGEITDYCTAFGKDIDVSTVKPLIQRFVKLRILRDKDENGRYELRHDSLALKIFEKITLVEKELLEVKTFIENAYSNFEKRNHLLNEEDLKYIAPYEDKLFLNERIIRFISTSKKEFHKARRRRQNILVAVATVIIVILSFFTIWALKERSNAVDQQKNAEMQKDAALNAKGEAEISKQQAEASRQIAEKNEGMAIEARNQSEQARKEAIASRMVAIQEKNRAEELSKVANEEARRAQNERKIADEQRIVAQAAEEKAKRLRLLSTAQNLALKSLSMEKEPVLMGLVAAQAYAYNRENSGSGTDPVIYEALFKAWTVLDSSRHQVFKSSTYEIRTMADFGDAILTADLEGVVREWKSDGTNRILPEIRIPGPVDFISFSPSGKFLVYSTENSDLFMKNIEAYASGPEFKLPGHKRVVTSAAFCTDDSFLATGGADSMIFIWNIKNNDVTLFKSFRVPAAVRSLAFCNQDTLASVLEDFSIEFRNISDENNLTKYDQQMDKALCVAYNSADKKVYAGYASGMLDLYSVRSSGLNSRRLPVSTVGIDQIVFDADGSRFAVSCWDRSIRLFNYHIFMELNDPVGGTIRIEDLPARSRILMFDRAGRLISGMGDKTIRVWETSSEKIYGEIWRLIKRNMTEDEWLRMVGRENPYQNTFGDDLIYNR